MLAHALKHRTLLKQPIAPRTTVPLKFSFVEGKSKKDGGLTDTPIVFLHSLLGSGAMFKNYATALEVSAYLPDLRNHGLSRPYIDSMDYVDMAHDVREMLD